MTSYAAVVSLMNTMKQIQIHPRLSFAFDNKQFEFLFEKLGFLLHHIKGNSHGGSKEEEVEKLIARAAHAAEDIIESHIMDQIHAAGSISLLDLGKVLTTFDSPMNEVMEFEKEKESNKVEQIGSADESIQPVESLLSSNDVHQTTHSMRTATSSRPQISITAKNTMMIGFEEELNQLMVMLTGQQSSRQIIPIVGMGGIGKTTLARNAYENQTSVDHFDIRAWATISQSYNVREILLQLLSIKRESPADTGTEGELGEKLHKSLCGRRYLTVLDDLWSVEAWEKIMFFFPDNNVRSRVVVTTRLSNIGTYFTSSCLAMNFLEEDKSWNLFQEKAFGQQGCPPGLETIGMEIAKKCNGLPLSIAVIGGFLGKSPMTKKYWENVAKDINSVLNSGEDDDDEHCSNILSTSYTHLPSHLKPCFLYMGVFEEDEEISVSRLAKLWVSEGFLEPNEAQTLEEIAEGYVNDLADMNLIMFSRREVSVRIQIHDVLRELCLRIGEKDKFMRVIQPFNFPRDMSSDRRLVLPGGIPDPFHIDDKNYYCPEDFEALRSASLARSLICPRGQLRFKLRLLRVLERVTLPLEFIDQVNLRYLFFEVKFNSDPFEKKEFDMWNLQTLNGTESSRKSKYFSPLEIWEMQQLRHLEVENLYVTDPDQQQRSGFVLRNLQTLEGVLNLMLNADVCRRIPNVRKLGISYDHFSGSLYECQCLGNLSQLHKLETLCLYFFGVEPSPQNLVRKLVLFPSALRKLTLGGYFEIRWEDLTSIGSCPNLEVLILSGVRLRGSEWSPNEGEFVRLKMLEIEPRENHLIRWNADYTHFPSLEYLVLKSLYSLEEIPSGIGDIPTLRHIFLLDPADSTALSAVRILQDQLDNSGYEELQVRVIFRSRARLESFKKLMMESESFTCKNVQLTSYERP